MLDDGRITDGQGRTVDFSNTVIIMTSNVGSQFIMDESDTGKREKLVMGALRESFRPEFLNRIDETIIFDRLDVEMIKEIVKIQLARVVKRLEAKGLALELTDAAGAIVAKEGYDPVYGARPLKRAIQHLILDPLSMAVLEGTFKDGDTIVADAADGAIVFRAG